jgi:hypothetical protein
MRVPAVNLEPLPVKAADDLGLTRYDRHGAVDAHSEFDSIYFLEPQPASNDNFEECRVGPISACERLLNCGVNMPESTTPLSALPIVS